MDVNESEYIGTPLKDAPKPDASDTDCLGRKKQKRDGEVVKDDDENTLFGGYCRCWPGKGTDHVGEGRCSIHGGNSSGQTGPDNGNYKHGLNSTVLREEDEEMLEKIQSMSTAAKLEETFDLQMVKLYRAVDTMEQNSQNEFWDAFADLLEKVERPEETDLRSLAQMLGQNDRAIREWMDLIRKTAKDINKIRDGETVKHEHGFDAEELEELAETADDMF